MSWYRENRYQWKEIIETVAREIGKSEQMVEKDTIQSMFLLELSKSELPFVFKGGTLLSKAYDIINRFSEDVDISMNKNPTQSEKAKSKETIIRIASELGLILTNEYEIMSRYDYNKYIFEYESLFSSIPLEIIVETSYYQRVYPIEQHNVSSFVGKFCKERNIELPISFEAANFIMNVQSLERTFIDKVFAVCDYVLLKKYERNSRHLYDICKLLSKIELNDGLDSLVDEVRNDRMHFKSNPSALLDVNIPNLVKDIIKNKYYESDYNAITQKLLYENISYEHAIEQGLSIISKLDIFEYKN